MENPHDEVHIWLYWFVSFSYILDIRWLVVRDQSLCDTINWWFYFFHLKLTGIKFKIKLDKYEKI